MRAKNKSFIEDTFILFVIGLIIYLAYSFFFSSDNKIDTEENNTVIETNIDKELAIVEMKKEEVVSEEIDKSINEVQKEEVLIIEDSIKTKSKTLIEEIDSKEVEKPVKEVEKPVIEVDDEKVRVELFYKDIREKIYENIEKNLEKDKFKSGEFINIRLTILKNGKYEQLTFMEGNNEYFNLVKPSIIKVFPVKIEDSLKNGFPRYFRMKIEF